MELSKIIFTKWPKNEIQNLSDQIQKIFEKYKYQCSLIFENLWQNAKTHMKDHELNFIVYVIDDSTSIAQIEKDLLEIYPSQRILLYISEDLFLHEEVQYLAAKYSFCIKQTFINEFALRLLNKFNNLEVIQQLNIENQSLLTQNDNLQRITITDELTNLFNMRHFKERLNQEFIRAERYDKFLSLIMFDIDNFKNVNDFNDHLMGSFILSQIGKIVHETIRTVDIAARYGGDEYVIILPETGPDGSLKMAERLLNKINQTVFDNNFHQYQVTISLGIANMGPGLFRFQDATSLLRKADEFMYKAKNSGRNNVKCILN